MNNEIFEKGGKTYWTEPTIEVRVNGMRRFSHVETFEWCCDNMELADVIERKVYPQYHVSENGGEDHVSFSEPLIVVVRERLSLVKDTRFIQA